MFFYAEAANENHIDMVNLLLSRGADVNLTTQSGQTASDLTRNHVVLRALLAANERSTSQYLLLAHQFQIQSHQFSQYRDAVQQQITAQQQEIEQYVYGIGCSNH